ncbi:MAG: zinc ABC transporter substrate-binding protein [Spirochaetes bacterium]|nr:zinc ABC transporter substrate-binding protein [Spirochaetota bacterium]
MKRWLIFFVLLVFIISCQQKNNNGNNKIKVTTTLFALYDFSKVIGKDLVDVKLLLPPGVEPHHYEPTPKDVFSINESDIFIYINKYMEPWAEEIVNVVGNDKLIIVEAAEGVKLIKYDDYHEHQLGSDVNHFTFDPHIWLDFYNCMIIADNITKALIQKDQINKDIYLSNCNNYKNDLLELDKLYEAVLQKCRVNSIIYAGHFAFGYLAKRYGLVHLSPYKGFSPDSEPTAGNIIDMIENIKNLNVKYIFYEELLDPKAARTISEQTKLDLLLLSAAHNISKSELDNNINFIDIMMSNLENLKKGLDYKK